MYQYTSNITNLDNIINNKSNDYSTKSFFSSIEEELVFLTKQFTHTPSEKVTNKTLIHFSDKNKFSK